MNNRVMTILGQPDQTERWAAMQRLRHGLSSNREKPLCNDEIRSLCRALTCEDDTTLRSLVWQVLLSASHAGIRDQALSALEKEGDPHRMLAAAYLLRHYRQLMPELAVKYAKDSNLGVRKVLSDYVGTLDLEKSIDMKIELLDFDVPYELGSTLEIEIVGEGNKRHLEKLRREDKVRGGGTIYGRIGKLLESRLAVKRGQEGKK